MRISLTIVSSFVVLNLLGQSTVAVSPADQRIADARKVIAASPRSFEGYNQLATALCRKARDTSDLSLYDQANAAVDRALELSPGQYEASRLRVSVLLGRHDFAQALKLAHAVNKRTPDDIAGWALLADANIGLGNYEEAVQDAQWVLDLRSGNALGFEKAARLREVYGDNEGAIEFYGEALRRTAQSDLDQRAWLFTQQARLTLANGHAKTASEILATAVQLFPASQQAAFIKADIAAANGNYAESATLFEKCYRNVSSANNLYLWAKALDKAGQKDDASKQYAAFEIQARAEISQTYNANIELTEYYVNRKNDPAEALHIATMESSKRQDSPTLAALAWALYQNNKFAEAKTQMDKALAVGVREASYFCHAARISAKLNNAADTAKFEKEAATFGANACSAESQMQASIGVAK